MKHTSQRHSTVWPLNSSASLSVCVGSLFCCIVKIWGITRLSRPTKPTKYGCKYPQMSLELKVSLNLIFIAKTMKNHCTYHFDCTFLFVLLFLFAPSAFFFSSSPSYLDLRHLDQLLLSPISTRTCLFTNIACSTG